MSVPSSDTGRSRPPELQGSRILGEGRWMRLREIRYRDGWGNEGIWESAERCKDRGAVIVIARLRQSGELLLVKQYRPPVGGWTLEFPAGLVDEDEDPAETALRELREETGYAADSVRLFPSALSSPGLTNESAQFARVEIDLEDARNRCPQQQLKGSEQITVCRVPEGELLAFLEHQRCQGLHIDMRVLAVAIGRARRLTRA